MCIFVLKLTIQQGGLYVILKIVNWCIKSVIDGEAYTVSPPGTCIQRIDEDFDILYYPRAGLPPLNIGDYMYLSIPKCCGLLDQTALEVSGILRMQMQPALRLTGSGG